jgi:hypothetical protein
VVISPLRHIDEYFQDLPLATDLNTSLTSLLETLDIVISPKVTVRVGVEQDLTLAISQPDFFQLVGHMVLHAVEHAGATGELSIETGKSIPGQGVAITITAESRKVTPMVQEDKISHLIHGDFSDLLSFSDLSEKTSFGLVAAQKIAEIYRSSIEYQQPQQTIIKVRVRLPVSKKYDKNT